MKPAPYQNLSLQQAPSIFSLSTLLLPKGIVSWSSPDPNLFSAIEAAGRIDRKVVLALKKRTDQRICVLKVEKVETLSV